MVDIAILGVGVLDRLIRLLTVDERNREKYFQQFIDPLYKDAEAIMNDYVALLTELIELLKKTDSTEEVVGWIEQRRSKMLPLRIKVRALLNNDTIDPKKVPEASRLFVKGLWGVMKGGISLVEEGHTPMREYGYGDHTVLDLLKRFRCAQTYGLLIMCIELRITLIRGSVMLLIGSDTSATQRASSWP